MQKERNTVKRINTRNSQATLDFFFFVFLHPAVKYYNNRADIRISIRKLYFCTETILFWTNYNIWHWESTIFKLDNTLLLSASGCNYTIHANHTKSTFLTIYYALHIIIKRKLIFKYYYYIDAFSLPVVSFGSLSSPFFPFFVALRCTCHCPMPLWDRKFEHISSTMSSHVTLLLLKESKKQSTRSKIFFTKKWNNGYGDLLDIYFHCGGRTRKQICPSEKWRQQKKKSFIRFVSFSNRNVGGR